MNSSDTVWLQDNPDSMFIWEIRWTILYLGYKSLTCCGTCMSKLSSPHEECQKLYMCIFLALEIFFRLHISILRHYSLIFNAKILYSSDKCTYLRNNHHSYDVEDSIFPEFSHLSTLFPDNLEAAFSDFYRQGRSRRGRMRWPWGLMDRAAAETVQLWTARDGFLGRSGCLVSRPFLCFALPVFWATDCVSFCHKP